MKSARLRTRRVLLGVGLIALLSVAPASPAVTSEFVAVADTYVTEAHPSSDRGHLSYMRADASPTRTMYLRFEVDGIGPESTVALRLWVTEQNATGLDVRPVGSDWDENAVTFETAPTAGPIAARTGPFAGEGWTTVDVTSLVQENGVVSLALTTQSKKSIYAATREAAAAIRPRLIVTSPDPTPPPLSPFTVIPTGTAFRAESAAGVIYTGTLKSVVESAAAQLAGAGGGVIRFGPGTFDLGRDALEFQGLSDVQFEGAGADATIIRNSSIEAIDTEVFDLARANRVAIRDMTLHAGGSSRTTSDAIDVDGGNDNLIERVRITASRGRGIVFDGKDLFQGNALTAERNVVRDCTISGVPSDGVQLLAGSLNRVERCTIIDAGRHGISIVKASAQAGQPNKQPQGNVLSENVVRGAGDDGINITSGDANELRGNIVVNSSSAVSGGDGIRIASTDGASCNGNVIDTNSATDNRAVKRQRYGLNISDPLCAATDVRTNDFAGNLRGPIQDLGTGTVFSTSVDLEPPAAPSGVAATATDAGHVEVTWAEATDNVAVTGYTVYRDGLPVGSVPGTARSFIDASVAGGTAYTYAVDAFDAVGNHSDRSSDAAVTTPASASVVTFVAVADAYVNQDSPGASFGNAIALRTDSEPILLSFLRFDVSGIVGTPIKATLRVYANTSSAEGYEVRSVTGAWDETVAYDTAPAVGGLVLASGAFVGDRYTEVDVTSAVTGNGIFDFALTGAGPTAVSYGSRESANPPQLVIEFVG